MKTESSSVGSFPVVGTTGPGFDSQNRDQGPHLGDFLPVFFCSLYTRGGCKCVVCVGSMSVRSCMDMILQLKPDRRLKKINNSQHEHPSFLGGKHTEARFLFPIVFAPQHSTGRIAHACLWQYYTHRTRGEKRKENRAQLNSIVHENTAYFVIVIVPSYWISQRRTSLGECRCTRRPSSLPGCSR